MLQSLRLPQCCFECHRNTVQWVTEQWELHTTTLIVASDLAQKVVLLSNNAVLCALSICNSASLSSKLPTIYTIPMEPKPKAGSTSASKFTISSTQARHVLLVKSKAEEMMVSVDRAMLQARLDILAF